MNENDVIMNENDVIMNEGRKAHRRLCSGSGAQRDGLALGGGRRMTAASG